MLWNSVTRWLACKANSVTCLVPPPPRTPDEAKRQILLVHAHPVADSFNAALAAAVEAGAKDGGHQVRRRNLYIEGFQPALSAAERVSYFNSDQGLARAAPEVRSAIDDLKWCDSVVFVYPTWWFNLPAVLKGWLDRSLLPGSDACWDFPGPGEGGGLVPKLTNVKRMAGVTTYGASRYITLLAGDNGRNCLATAVRQGVFGPDCTCRWLSLHDMDFIDDNGRKAFLEDVYRTFRDLF